MRHSLPGPAQRPRGKGGRPSSNDLQPRQVRSSLGETSPISRAFTQQSMLERVFCPSHGR
eukprot:1153086-Pelagomonas_calceolata.AAC.7